MNRTVALLILASAFAAFGVSAAPNSYDCQISARYLHGIGELIADSDKPRPDDKNYRFVVERATGRVIAHWTLKLILDDPLLVEHRAVKLADGRDVGLLVMYRGHNSGFASFLSIQEGVEGPDKPFTLMSGMSIFTGTCR